MVAREFDITSLYYIWDYIFSGIDLSSLSDQAYDRSDYYFQQCDPLINLDYICLAILSSLRKTLFQMDQTECVTLLFNVQKIERADSIL